MRCTFLALLALPLAARAADWQAGVASVVITPREATWLSGYGGRTKPAEGKVHDLHTKALALQDRAGTRLVLVTLDLGSVSQEIYDAVLRRVEKPHGLRKESLLLNVSHTHCAPEVAAERRVFHALPDEEEARLVRYIAWLEDRIVEVIDGAIRDLKPAILAVGQGSAEFASNRRLPTPQGFINSQNIQGVTDHSVPVLSVAGDDGKLRAVLFGYACHNTTLNFQLYCGDYAGFAQAEIETAHSGTTALFLMGCGGDQNPYPRHGPRGLDHAKAHGKALADAVETALRGQVRKVAGPMRLGYEIVPLALEPLPPRERIEAQAASDNALAQRKAKYLLHRLDREKTIDPVQPCPLHVARLGNDLLLLAISGETVVDYALRSKAEFAGPFVWVAGYCDDVFAYLPSDRVLREGGYEGRDGILHQLTPTPFATAVEGRVMGGLRRLVKQTAPSPDRLPPP